MLFSLKKLYNPFQSVILPYLLFVNSNLIKHYNKHYNGLQMGILGIGQIKIIRLCT